MTERDFNGRDLQEAISGAARAMGTSAESVEFTLVRETRGLLGALPVAVTIRVAVPAGTPNSLRKPHPARRAPERPVKSGPVVEKVVELEVPEPEPEGAVVALANMARAVIAEAGLDLSVAVTDDADSITLDLAGPDRELLIVRAGELLEALQYLVGRMARRAAGVTRRVRLESEGYRSDRDGELRERALEAAQEARQSRRVVRLPPLNGYERRIVHMALSEVEGIVTESEGDGVTKRIAVWVDTGDGRRPRSPRGGREGNKPEVRRRR